MKKKSFCLVFIMMLFFSKAFCQSAEDITGFWLTLDKKTNEPKSQIEIYKDTEGKFYGKIVWLKKNLKNNQPLRDENNQEEELRNRKVLGLQILSGLEYTDDGEWDNGNIYDPESGKTYDCRAWFEDNDMNKLNLRGFVGFSLLGRSVEWTRENIRRQL